MTRRSPNIAIAALFVPVLIAAIAIPGRSAADQDGSVRPGPGFEDCPTDKQTTRVAEHFSQYCGRCHLAQRLAADAQKTGNRDQAKSDMVTFLARHGACPAEIDEAIADYLINLKPTS